MKFNCVEFVLASSVHTDTINAIKEAIIHLLLSDLTSPNSMGETVGLKCDGFYDWDDAKMLLEHATKLVTLNGNKRHSVRMGNCQFDLGFAGKENLAGLKSLLTYIINKDVHYDLSSCTKTDPVLFSHGKFLDHSVIDTDYPGDEVEYGSV